MQITAAYAAVTDAIAKWDPTSIPDSLKDLATPTPKEVIITTEPRPPAVSPTLGIDDVPRPVGAARHRLVAIGDSLTHGFQSDAIFNTDWSYPAMIARELGWYDSFVHPEYRGFGGIPLNIEYLVREVEQRYGENVQWWKLGAALFTVYDILTQIRDYWEHGGGSQIPNYVSIMHNLAISGYDVRDVLSKTAAYERQSMQPITDSLLRPLVENAGQLIALYVLSSANANYNSLSPVDLAGVLGADGIETLIVFIGANNALGSIIALAPHWTEMGNDDYQNLDTKGKYNVWNPVHFALEYDELASKVWDIDAQHVIWCTVPHVTIAPLAHGIGPGKVAPSSRYFPYYTYPWVTESTFDPTTDHFLTANQARAIDSAIDQYNSGISAVVEFGRRNKKDWLILDIAGLLDRVAARRYILDPSARPTWWTPYPLPGAVAALTPPVDSQFFGADTSGRTQGGLFSLDGVHGTTVTYALLAQECINVMVNAGVPFYQADGTTPRPGPIAIDFGAMIGRDTLLSDPPRSLTADLRWASWLNELLDWVTRLGRVL